MIYTKFRKYIFTVLLNNSKVAGVTEVLTFDFSTSEWSNTFATYTPSIPNILSKSQFPVSSDLTLCNNESVNLNPLKSLT